jgi:type I restriction enzyme S subunit
MSGKHAETLADYFDLQRGMTYKSALKGHPGPTLLGLGSIERDGGFRLDKLTSYGGDSPAKLLVRPGELFVSLKDVTQAGDLLGAVARVPSGVSVGRLTQDTVKLVPNRPDVPNAYLYWLLRTPDVRALCRSRATGTTNLGLAREDFLSIPVPPLTDERATIVELLEAIEERLTLHGEMNRTLEEMAQALFKSWFIDFDGHDDLVDSEIGPVPRGWEVRGIDAVADNVRDTVDPSSLPHDTPYVGLEHVPRRCVALDTWGRASEAESTKTRFQRGDTLFGKLRPNFHKVVPAPVDGVASTDILVIRPMQDDWRWFAFGHLYSDAMVAHTTAAADGTKMPRTNWKDLCRFPVALPPKERAAEYGRTVTPMYERIAANVQESRTLAELRDTLLPKLISGELRVPEAEDAVGPAAGPRSPSAGSEAPLP